MNIKSINETRTNNSEQDGLFDLFQSSFLYRQDIAFETIEVQEHEEMRIDLIFQRMYNYEPNEVGIYLDAIDVILFINHIDNPLNVRKGMILKFPLFGEIGNFRFTEETNRKSDRKPLLAVPNVSTRKDKSREQFKNSNFSLPPVALAEPRPSIRRDDGTLKIGGL